MKNESVGEQAAVAGDKISSFDQLYCGCRGDCAGFVFTNSCGPGTALTMGDDGPPEMAQPIPVAGLTGCRRSRPVPVYRSSLRRSNLSASRRRFVNHRIIDAPVMRGMEEGTLRHDVDISLLEKALGRQSARSLFVTRASKGMPRTCS